MAGTEDDPFRTGFFGSNEYRDDLIKMDKKEKLKDEFWETIREVSMDYISCIDLLLDELSIYKLKKVIKNVKTEES